MQVLEMLKQESNDALQQSWRFDEDKGSDMKDNGEKMQDSKLVYDADNGGWGVQGSNANDLDKVGVKMVNQEGMNQAAAVDTEEEKNQPRKDSEDHNIDSMIKNEDNLFDLAKSYEEVQEQQKSAYRVYTLNQGDIQQHQHQEYKELYLAANAYHQNEDPVKVLVAAQSLIYASGDMNQVLKILSHAKEQGFLQKDFTLEEIQKVSDQPNYKDM